MTRRIGDASRFGGRRLWGVVIAFGVVALGIGAFIATRGDGSDDTPKTRSIRIEGGTEDPANLPVSCGNGPAYPRSALHAPVGAERGTDAAAAGLRKLVTAQNSGIGPLPDTGWRRLVSQEDVAVFSHGELGDGFIELKLDRKNDGTFGFAGSSNGCSRTRVWMPDRSLVRTALAPDTRLTPKTTSFVVRATEGACTGGTTMGDRLGKPVIVYGSKTVGILFTADPLPAGAYTCPGNPSEDVTVGQSEPLGNRRLLDVSSYPATPIEHQ